MRLGALTKDGVGGEGGSPDDLHAAEVRAADALWVSRGINGVPAVVVEGKWLISGAAGGGV
ncbi:hypothetical protein [Brevundimonas vitis]|uniref:hypothetical protein n=1 Tax=Brevundimonas vitisensis TaxID=2800818 RepID=UPI001E3855CF|nr:hypothetical protein [Brevundimonas vitisensis]